MGEISMWRLGCALWISVLTIRSACCGSDQTTAGTHTLTHFSGTHTTPHTLAMLQSLVHRACRASHSVSFRSAVTISRPLPLPLLATPTAPSRSAHSRAARKQIMGRSFTGIFAGKHIHFGHMVSHSERKTRRTWKPNVQSKTFYSSVLGRELDIKITMAALRTFDKYGGLDRYILRTPLHRLDEGYSRELRTTMELQLLKDPRIAQDLNLMDVLERLKRPSEVKRLRKVVTARQEWARSVGHMKHPILSTPMPDGTTITLPEVTEEELEQRRAARVLAMNADYLARKAHLERGLTDEQRSRIANGISIPKNKARAGPWTGPRQRRATFENPFTKPKKMPTTQA